MLCHSMFTVCLDSMPKEEIVQPGCGGQSGGWTAFYFNTGTYCHISP